VQPIAESSTRTPHLLEQFRTIATLLKFSYLAIRERWYAASRTVGRCAE
jgi:hypothetical protein